MRRARLNRINAAIGNNQIVGPSSQRVAIRFFTSAQNNYSVSTDPLTAVGDGAFVNNGANQIELTIEQHGEIVQMGWFAWAIGAMTINVLEVLA